NVRGDHVVFASWTLEHESTLNTPAYLPARHDTHHVTCSVRSGVRPHGEGAHARIVESRDDGTAVNTCPPGLGNLTLASLASSGLLRSCSATTRPDSCPVPPHPAVRSYRAPMRPAPPHHRPSRPS